VTPLWAAAVSGRLAVVKTLLRHGANVDAISDSGSTPVRSACYIVRPGIGGSTNHLVSRPRPSEGSFQKKFYTSNKRVAPEAYIDAKLLPILLLIRCPVKFVVGKPVFKKCANCHFSPRKMRK
jgi:hypothetical protein